METKVTGNKVTIELDITKGVPSSTGKSMVVFSTSGFVPVEGTDLKVSINVIRPNKR